MPFLEVSSGQKEYLVVIRRDSNGPPALHLVRSNKSFSLRQRMVHRLPSAVMCWNVEKLLPYPSRNPPPPALLSRLFSYVFQVPEDGDGNLAYNDVEGQGVPGRVFNTNLRSPDVESHAPEYVGGIPRAAEESADAGEGKEPEHVKAKA